MVVVQSCPEKQKKAAETYYSSYYIPNGEATMDAES